MASTGRSRKGVKVEEEAERVSRQRKKHKGWQGRGRSGKDGKAEEEVERMARKRKK